MAYAALDCLLLTIKDLLDSARVPVASPTRESLQSAQVEASSLGSTLERCSQWVRDMDEQFIIQESRKLEDAIEFPLSLLECGDAFDDQLIQDLDSFAQTAKKMKKTIQEMWDLQAAKMIEEYIEELFFLKKTEEKTEEEEEEDVSSMVGLSDQFLQIRDKLIAEPQRDEVVYIGKTIIWISGMAGIGKTRLAKKLFHDPSMMSNFECRAFVKVGHHYRRREILEAIAAQLNLKFMEGEEDLHKSFSRFMSARKSLIVLDDVWDDFLDSDLFFTGIQDNGSRILVTSRRWTDSNDYFVWDLKLRFMNEEESWELLRRNVFGEDEDDEDCPSQLVKAGKKIAEKCEGLPLLIIAVAAQLLSKVGRNVGDWIEIARKQPNSVFEDACDQISEVLLSSYRHLNEASKVCFLYIAAFPLTHKVRRSTLINLWCAEGFHYKYCFETMVEQNLVLGHDRCWYKYSNKACSLHCAYWYVSRRVAENNKFLYTMNSYADGVDERVESHLY